MRKELKTTVDVSHELYESDFSNTLRLARKFAEARARILPEDQAFTAKESNLPEDAEMEVLDDMAYYTWVDMQYIWHYCLWRLQAILEGLITGTFLKGRPILGLIGLKSKLDALRERGYTVDDSDYVELLEWAKLRNVLSHHPPGSYFPGPLDEPDVEEYCALCKRVCTKWREQYDKMAKPATISGV